MPRYFIELSYKGTAYSGFQVQENAVTIQSEVEKAFGVLHRNPVVLTGSSRTDAGVHALQNFFHFDYEGEINPRFVYKMNAILPADIVVKEVYAMPADAHARFQAVGREYKYRIHRFKDPFLKDVSYFFPYKLDMERMQEAATMIKEQKNFYAFSKTNSQVNNFDCIIKESRWGQEGDSLVYQVQANRFLRGMVRLITGSLLKVGRHKISLEDFEKLFSENVRAGYSVPAHGLFLSKVIFPENYFPVSGLPFTAF
jgi:tRNA pseudouridine38-40 synthase